MSVTTLQLAETALIIVLRRAGLVAFDCTQVNYRERAAIERAVLLAELRAPTDPAALALSTKLSNLMGLIGRNSGDLSDIRLHPSAVVEIQGGGQ
jgi:hypothetical protein